MLLAKRYDILRQVAANGRVSLPLAEKPCRVATLLDEAAFLAGDGALVHNRTVFLEDHLHDWQWKDGRLTYYTRIATQADVVVVYEEENTLRPALVAPSSSPTPAVTPRRRGPR